jgi:hypothetical protein
MVAVREGTPLYGVPVTVTVNVPVGKLHVSIELTELFVAVNVTGPGCRLQT